MFIKVNSELIINSERTTALTVEVDASGEKLYVVHNDAGKFYITQPEYVNLYANLLRD